MKPKITTDADFDIFKTEIQRLIKQFHLNGWNIYYENKDNDNTCNASVVTDVVTRAATFRLSKKIFLYTPDEIKETALHEVCHLILADIDDLAYSRFVSKEEIIKESERTTNLIANILTELSRNS